MGSILCFHSKMNESYVSILLAFSAPKVDPGNDSLCSGTSFNCFANRLVPIMLEMLPIVPSSTSQKIYPLFLFYAFIITYYSHKILLAILHAGSSGVKCCWCSSKTSTVRAALLLTVLLEYIDLFGRIQPTAPPSATRALNHCHQVWQYSKHHAQKGPKILKLCLWASYNSGIIPSKMWTYNSLNYAGILGASL